MAYGSRQYGGAARVIEAAYVVVVSGNSYGSYTGAYGVNYSGYGGWHNNYSPPAPPVQGQVAGEAALASTSAMGVSPTGAAYGTAALVSISSMGVSGSKYSVGSAALVSVSTLGGSATTYSGPVTGTVANVVVNGIDGNAFGFTRVVRHLPHALNQIGFNQDHSHDRRISNEILFSFSGVPTLNKLSPAYVLQHPGLVSHLSVSCGKIATTNSTVLVTVTNIIDGVPTPKVITVLIKKAVPVIQIPAYIDVQPGDYITAKVSQLGTGLEDVLVQVYF